MRALSRLLHGKHVVIDTMVFIYLFEDSPRYGDVAESIFKLAASGKFCGVLTPVTVAELMVKPLSLNRHDIADYYRNALQSMHGMQLEPMSHETGFIAGALRAKYKMPLPDMIQVAFALRFSKSAIITNDIAMRKINEVEAIMLDEI